MRRPIPVRKQDALRLAESFINWELAPRGADFCIGSYAENVEGLRVVQQDNHIFTMAYTTVLREDWRYVHVQRDVEDGIFMFNDPLYSSTYKRLEYQVTLLIPYGTRELHMDVNYVDHELLKEEIITPEAIEDGSY